MSRDATPKTIYLRDYRPPAYTISDVHLHFDLREAGTRVATTLHVQRRESASASEPLWLDGEELKLLELRLDGERLPEERFDLTPTGLRIRNLPERFELQTLVEIAPEANTALEGLYRSSGMFCTQCEAEGFRRITYYIDRPDVMARFTTTIEADAGRYPVLLSNGNPVAEKLLDNGRREITWEDPFPKPSYLFALVAGDLALLEETYTTASGRNVALRIYSEPENIDKCGHAMASLKNAMRWDEEKYGREYDLDIFMIVAVNDFNMGAMENKGLNIFNAKLVLAQPDTATDRDYEAIEAVVGHEYFHNWSGNRITCRDWFQLSLKEGFTVYRDQEFSADMGSRGVKRIEDVRLLRAHQFAEDASPMAHPVRPDSYMEINNFYTLTVYEKGAEVVRMQANLLGPELFRKATDLYFERHDGEAVTTDDFVKCMEDTSHRNLDQFRRWYSQGGTPELHVEGKYDEAASSYTLKVKQSCPPTPGQENKLPFHIPFAVGLLETSGRELPLKMAGEGEQPPGTRLLELTEEEHSFTFAGIESRPVPSLLRGFSAPVKLHYDYSDQELMFLMARDSDGFVRWDAAQELHLRILLKRIADPQSRLPDGYLEAIGHALYDIDDDKALIAEIIRLPSESYIGDQMESVDVDAIHFARRNLMREIASELRQDLDCVCAANTTEGEYRPDHAHIARRELSAAALGYLAELDNAASRRLVIDRYRAQRNMTEVISALGIIADSEWDEREELLADFEKRWKEQPLALDKWFSVQAMSRRADTLERVRALMEHPGFHLSNPNRVRSLIGAFVTGNPRQFHRGDGEGYRLLADVVIELDGKNPQVAARLIRQMSRWRRYDKTRQQLMRGQLERIAGQDRLSKDVAEIVTRSLES